MPDLNAPVRYGGTALEQGFLRHALLEAWNWQCAWCKRVLASDQTEIDHIVPPGKLEDARKPYSLPPIFDVQATPNLVPACAGSSGCNRRKSNKVFDGIGNGMAVLGLSEARKRAPRVDAMVRRLRASRDLAAPMTHLLETSLETASREAFRDYAGALVQRVLAVAPAAVVDAPIEYSHSPKNTLAMGEVPGCAPDDLANLRVILDSGGRSARVLMEVAGEVSFGEFLDEVLCALIRAVDEAVVENGLSSEISDSYALTGYRAITLTALAASRDDESLLVTFEGTYASDHVAMDWRDDQHGVRVENGSFDLSVFGTVTGSAMIPLIGDWDHGVEVDARSLEFDPTDSTWVRSEWDFEVDPNFD